MAKYTSIKPDNSVSDNPEGAREFSALVHVKSSRFDKHEYNDERLGAKIAIKWVLGTTKGNTFERTWSIGVPYEGNENLIADGGKRYTGDIKKNSDGNYLLKKAVESGFPADKLTDDISVFEGETFFMTTDANPNAQGSRRKPYPKYYKAEGWEAALQETLRRRAEREAQQNAPAYPAGDSTATLQSSYTPPAVAVQGDVLKTASEALVDILLKNGRTVTRSQIPAKLNTYVESTGKSWDKDFRQNVAIALWDMPQLQAVVGSNPNLKIDGETVSFK